MTPLPPTSPEMDLILACCRWWCCCRHRQAGGDGAATPARDLPVTTGLDWPTLGKLAASHAVGAAVYRALKAHSLGAHGSVVPEHALQEQRRLLLLNAGRSLRLTANMFAVIELLAAHDVQAIPVKGPVIAQMAYGDVAMRQFSDLDFLVKGEDIPAVREILLLQGYQQKDPVDGLAPRQRETHLRSRRGWSFFSPGSGTWIDVNPSLSSHLLWHRSETEEQIGRCRPIHVDTGTVATLDLEDTLLFLCLHGTRHRWARLGWVLDVAALIASRPDLDWDTVMARAQHWGHRRAVLMGVRLANDLVGIPAPDPVLESARKDGVAGALAAAVAGDLLTRAGDLFDTATARRYELQSLERLRDRLTYGIRQLLVPSVADMTWLPLPNWLHGAYHVLRPCRLGWGFLRGRAS